MGGGSRGSMGPLLLVNLVMYVLVLALAGWSLDKYIDRQTHRRKCSINSARGSQLNELQQFSLNFVCCADLGGNMSTEYLLIFALLAGAVGACSVLAGTMHLRAWRSDSLASAVSAGLVSWALTALSFGCVANISLLSVPTALNSDENTNHRPRMQADHSGESRAASGKANHAIFFFFRNLVDQILLNKSHQYKQLFSQRTLEAFIVILTFTQLLCLMLLCAGAVSSSYGPSCRNSGGGSGGSDYGVMSREQRDTTAASNAPPHA
uniref:Uncharacterized protein n=1 Tax=Ananas comosus var. bracteatus TaxID=296719 RepID=A0A6V7P6M0_ANACO|nr:unnamed protein product [Ananas comosus var. bracteatus]